MSTAADLPPADDRIDAGVLKIAGVVVLGAIMAVLDMTVVSVALPTFQSDFDATYAQVAWTMTGYTLALATVIPATGWAADRFGTKRLYLTALALFVAGSVLCSLADSVGTLVAFRVLQGLGGGMLMPLGMMIMTRAAGPARVGRVMAILGIPMLLGPIGGPILGGWLIESYSWHWIFLINLPIGVVALAAAAKALPKDAPEPSESFDLVGLLLMSPGLALLLYGVSTVPEEGTVLASKVLVPATVGVVLVLAFVRHAFKPEHPLIDLRLFKNRQLTVAVITMFVFAVAFFGAMLLIPTYFLQVRGETTLQAGLLLAPQGLGAMVTMPIAGRLVDRTGPGRVVLSGLVLVSIGMLALTRVGAETPYWALLTALFVMGLGMGSTMMPTMTAALQTLVDHTIARGSALMNIVQQVAASVGTAVMSVVLTNQLKGSELAGAAIASREDPSIAAQLPPAAVRQGFEEAASGFATTFTVAAALILLSVVPALLLPRRRSTDREDEGEAAPVVLH